MAKASKLLVDCLDKDELAYELAIRDIQEDTVAAMRKALGVALRVNEAWNESIYMKAYREREIEGGKWPIEYITYTATIPCALTGADLAIFASSFAYISDVSSTTNRTFRVSLLEVCYLFTIPVGVLLGSFLFKKVVFDSYASMFTINASLLIIAIVYSSMRLEWRTTEKQTPLMGTAVCTFFPDFFDKTHAIESLKIITKRRENYDRIYLITFFAMMALYTFQRDEKPFLYLYTQLKFTWNVESYSYFKTFQSGAYCIMTLFCIPLMNKILKWEDTVIIFVGSTAHALARVVYLLAEVPWVFYIGSVVSSVGPTIAPVIRSLVSKTVPLTERGKVFALLAVCDTAMPFISSVLYTQTYNATIGKIGAIFLLTITTQCGVFFMALFIHIASQRQVIAAKKTKSLIVATKEDF